MRFFQRWLHSFFSDTQLVLLFAVVTLCVAVVLSVGDLLTPVIASIVIAFLLEELVPVVQKLHLGRRGAVFGVFGLFILFLGVVLFGLVPLLVSQITDFVDNIPYLLARAQADFHHLPQKYPTLLTEVQVRALMDSLTAQLSQYSQVALAFSLSSIRSVFSFVLYLILVPVMVFFFLKDKDLIFTWLAGFLPADHSLVSSFWHEIQLQAGRYVRGRIWEVLLVWGATYLCFLLTGLDYALLLSLLVGLSVIIPYIGVLVVTAPVGAIALIEWGWSAQFFWCMACYCVIQLLDANVLVPLLLSGAVSLHPLAAIISILVFGGLWGFWGVFFAIPLATVVQAVLKACAAHNARMCAP